MKKLKNYALFGILAVFLLSCSGVSNQTWQPKHHPPANKKYGKKG